MTHGNVPLRHNGSNDGRTLAQKSFSFNRLRQKAHKASPALQLGDNMAADKTRIKIWAGAGQLL